MRILSALMVLVFICTPSAPAHAVATTVYLGGSFPIITIPTSDFIEMTPTQRVEWLEARNVLLQKIKADFESLNQMEAEDLIKQIKRDRCCSKGFNGAWYVSTSCLALGGIVTSALQVTPVWIGYVVAGVTGLSLFLGNRADFFSTRAVETQRDAENIQHQLDLDFQEKKRAHQQQLEHEAEVVYWQRAAQANLGGDDVVIVPPPRVGHRSPLETARVANLRALATVQDGNMEAVETMEQGLMTPVVVERKPAAPKKAVSSPKEQRRKGTWIKVRRKDASDATPPKPASQNGQEEGLLEPVVLKSRQEPEMEVVIDSGKDEEN